MAPRTANRRLTLAAAALLGCALAAPQAAAQGRVDVLNLQREVRAQSGAVVQSETLDEVRFMRGTSAKTVQTKDVVYIDYGKGSTSYERGLLALAEGDLLNAETLFAAASKDTDPPWVASHALLRQAEASARRGPAGLLAARGAVTEFLTSYADHRLLPDALLAEARYAAATGDLSTMQASVDKVVTLSRQNRVSVDWAARAQLLAGDLLLETDDPSAASRAYSEAESSVATGRTALGDRPDLLPVLERISLSARTGTASCMLASNDVAGARAYYSRLAGDGKGDASVQAAAQNGLAECDFRESGKLKDAQLGFAKVAISAVGTPAEHARALYFLGRCSEELDKAGREAGGRTRAITYFQEVANRYPETRWGRLAQSSLP